jgi:hypothetical protein
VTVLNDVPTSDGNSAGGSARTVRGAVLRTCSAYELVPLERMTARERTALRGFQQFTDTYGILRPREPGLTVLAVDDNTAVFYRAVSVAGQLSGFDYDRQSPSAVEQLVLDRVLEMATDGNFVSGPAAYAWLHPVTYIHCGRQRIAKLSLDALQYAQALLLRDSVALSLRLYDYNRLPLSPGWRRRLPSTAAMAGFLDIRAGGPTFRLLKEYWIESADTHWLRWRTHATSPYEHRPYKLYVSPRPEQLPETFGKAVRIFTEMRVSAFKVANTVSGILRPDKLIAYFARSDDLHAVAAQLTDRLSGIAAHGVPFTATDDPIGLLSWGVDPPPGSGRLCDRPISWRRWLTDRLAAALVLASATPTSECEPWEFALGRVSLAGVNVVTWQPQAGWSVGATSGVTGG